MPSFIEKAAQKRLQGKAAAFVWLAFIHQQFKVLYREAKAFPAYKKMTIKKKKKKNKVSFIQVVSIKVEGKKQSRRLGSSFIMEDVSPVLLEAFSVLTNIVKRSGKYVGTI